MQILLVRDKNESTVEDVSGKLIISKFPNRQCVGKKKVRACVIFSGV